MHEEIIIIGLGGVGSWLADFLTRANRKTQVFKRMIVVDHDIVESKNLERQNYTSDEIGMTKAEATVRKIRRIGGFATPYTTKIKSNDNLLKFNQQSLAVIATDNQESKNLIAKYFYNYIITNCDHDFAEIKTRLDQSDIHTWTINTENGGYTSQQDIQSNIRAAQMALTAIITGNMPRKYETKVQTETLLQIETTQDEEEVEDLT